MSDRRDLEGFAAASADETSAAAARHRLREEGFVALEPDERIAVLLAPGERVVAIRRGIAVERRAGVRDPELALRGDLYVTTARLVCLGKVVIDLPLVDVREAIVVAGAVRLAVGDGRGLELRTADPYLLRVEIAAAREAARIAAGSPCGPRPTVAPAESSNRADR